MITARKDGLAVLTLATQTAVGCGIFLIWTEIFLHLTLKLGSERPPYLICIGAMALGLGLTYRRVRSLLPLRGQWKWNSALFLAIYQTFAIGGALIMGLFVFKEAHLSRSFILGFLIVNFIILLISNRFLPRWILNASTPKNLCKRYLILGSEDTVNSFEDWIIEEKSLDTEFVGYLNAAGRGRDACSLQNLGDITALKSVIRRHHVTHVLVLEMIHSKSWFNYVAQTAEGHGCRLVIKNPLEDFLQRRLRYFSSADRLFFTLQREPLENPANRVIKRFFDTLIALPVCLFVLPPLFVLVAVMQHRQAPGPILFKQRRYGRNQESFNILKFRSMYHDADNSPEAEKRRALHQATRDDPRVYPFGAFMRKTSLDEFPQFLNVLLGKMSVVGPRPHPITLDQKYACEIQAYTSRHYVKPGITGLAQCKGLRGETQALELMSKRIHEDIAYLESWNPLLDVYILLRTLAQLVRAPRTAY